MEPETTTQDFRQCKHYTEGACRLSLEDPLAPCIAKPTCTYWKPHPKPPGARGHDDGFFVTRDEAGNAVGLGTICFGGPDD